MMLLLVFRVDLGRNEAEATSWVGDPTRSAAVVATRSLEAAY